jgi:peptidoglycan hydrolase-like protein with peptidoglycan-binding domain
MRRGIGMRTVAAILMLTAIVAIPDQASAARKPKPAASTPAETRPEPPTADPATAGPLRAVYGAMSLADRVSIQSDLIWTGDYNGVTDGEFSDRAIGAVKAFQKRNGGKDTGVLTPEERDKLAAAAQPRVDRVGWQMLDDQATGARIGFPSKLVPRSSPGKAGTHWQSARGEVQVDTFRVAAKGTTLASVLDQQKKDPAGRTVEYTVVKPDFFVISGLQGGVKKFYIRAHAGNDEVRGIAILYDQAMEGIVDRVVVAMSSAFTPFPSSEIASEIQRRALVRRTIEYATGVVVSASGHILADRSAVDGCKYIVVPGLGNAERLAEDKETNLALLRVYGADALVPLALARESGHDAETTLVGVADPQTQNGGNAVSTLRARLLAANGPGRTIEPMPALGFSGAAAIDSEGHLTGLVQIRPQVVAGPPAAGAGTPALVAPVETLRDFLTAQKVTPPSSDAKADPKASVVRVICVRK